MEEASLARPDRNTTRTSQKVPASLHHTPKLKVFVCVRAGMEPTWEAVQTRRKEAHPVFPLRRGHTQKLAGKQ